MSALAMLLGLAVCLALSALYSGSETAFYSLSQARLDADVHAKRRSAVLIQRLVRDERALLITLLVGNNVMLELLTRLADGLVDVAAAVPAEWREVVLTAVLTPIVFLGGELMPKDLFRRRPHTLLGYTAPIVALSKLVYTPLVLPLKLVAKGLERVLQLPPEEVKRTLGRERLIELLEEGARSGTIPPHARELAHNVLALRSIPVERVMVPWSAVQTLDLAEGATRLAERVADSSHTRLPVVQAGAGVIGYVHQLEALGSPQPGDLRRHLRPLPAFEPDLPVDRALSRMRVTGQRAALVGRHDRALGLVTLKDLVQTISGDLVDW